VKQRNLNPLCSTEPKGYVPFRWQCCNIPAGTGCNSYRSHEVCTYTALSVGHRQVGRVLSPRYPEDRSGKPYSYPWAKPEHLQNNLKVNKVFLEYKEIMVVIHYFKYINLQSSLINQCLVLWNIT
jgi:hypothetical protein